MPACNPECTPECNTRQIVNMYLLDMIRGVLQGGRYVDVAGAGMNRLRGFNFGRLIPA